VSLETLASVPPPNTLQLTRDVASAFGVSPSQSATTLALRDVEPNARHALSTQVDLVSADASLQTMKTFRPSIEAQLSAATANAGRQPQAQAQSVRVFAFRSKAAPFGYNAPLRATVPAVGSSVTYTEWDITSPGGTGSNDISIQQPKTLFLDAEYVVPLDSWVVIEGTAATPRFVRIDADTNTSTNVATAGYGLSGKSTRLSLTANWYDPGSAESGILQFRYVRAATIYVQSEELTLADEPITQNIDRRFSEARLVLDGLYDGLVSGRWAIVIGERADIEVPGVKGAELVMLAEVQHYIDTTLPGDTTHTYIRFAQPLAFTYKRDTVIIYGNVVKATHGETRNETLGAGDGSKVLQSFALRQPPLTYVPSPTPAGAESTLKVYVNDVEWHEADALADLGRRDRAFITKTDDDGKTTVVFGNGVQGARLPTGQDNVKAVYRNGIGAPGNVRAEQISLLVTRPLGAKDVINPLAASGGADKESRDQARKNAPLAVMALDRLVSVQDY